MARKQQQRNPSAYAVACMDRLSRTIRLNPMKALLLLTCLGACSAQADELPGQTEREMSRPPASRLPETGSPENAAPTRLPPLPDDAGKLPPPTRKHRFVGRWAESLQQCRARSWWLSDGPGFTLEDGRRCDLREISGRRNRYRAIAWCSPPPSNPGQLDVGHSVTFTFDEARQRMKAEGLDFPDAGLVYCGTEE